MPISTLAAQRLSKRDVRDSIEYQQRKVGSLRSDRWKPLANIMLEPPARESPHAMIGGIIPLQQYYTRITPSTTIYTDPVHLVHSAGE